MKYNQTMKYDIFISYRREGGYDTAKHLNDLLVRDGYRVSFDIDTLRSGNFDTQLLERIDQCKDFIVVVDQHAFDRTLDPDFNSKNDWLRCELAYALKKNKNVIPVLLSGVNGFPDNLPPDVADVALKNGPQYNKYHFDAFYKDLKKRFLLSFSYGLVRRVIVASSALLLLTTIIIAALFIGRNTGNNTANSNIGNDSIVINKQNESIDDSQIVHAQYNGISLNMPVESFRNKLEANGYVFGEKDPAHKLMKFYNQFEELWVYYDSQTNKVWMVINIDLHYEYKELGNEGIARLMDIIIPEYEKEYKTNTKAFCDGADCIEIPGGCILFAYDKDMGALIMTIDEVNSNNYDNLFDTTYGVSPYGIEL